MHSIVVPIFDVNRKVVGASGLARPMHRLSDEVIQKHIPFVLNAALDISRRLESEVLKDF
jgi:DNA-binding IclR family transcriptional regulator